MTLITLTTDFGPASRYVAQMKGVLYSRLPAAELVDLSHALPPQDVHAGARFLQSTTPWYPPATVHLAVIDPGVGTERGILLVACEGHFYVGPDNGLFGWAAERAGARCITLSTSKIDRAGTSSTFHGRDLMAPAAALLASGTPIESLGEICEAPHLLPKPPQPKINANQIECEIVEVDPYGNLITNLPAAVLGDYATNQTLRIRCGEHETFGLWRTYGEQPPQTLIALTGSEGLVELAITQGSAAQMLDARVGNRVLLDWPSA